MLGVLAVSFLGLASKCPLMGRDGGQNWEERRDESLGLFCVSGAVLSAKEEGERKVIKWSSGCFAFLETEREYV